MILKEFQFLVNKLQSTTGRIEKENILSKYKGEDSLSFSIREILKFIFNPYIVTGISKKKINKPFAMRGAYPSSILGLMTYLEHNNTGKQEDIDVVRTFMEHNKEYEGLIASIVTKDLKLGVQPITLNKIFGVGFVNTFDVMLAEKYFDNPEKYLPENTPFTLTTKLDGVRCICISENGVIKFFTRQGQPIEGLIEIEEDIKKLNINYVFDGELLLRNRDNIFSKDLYRATVKETNKDGEKHDLIYNIFDLVRISSFKSGVDLIEYSTRKKELVDIYSEVLIDYDLPSLKIVENLYQGTDQSYINYWLDKITSEGGEGVMININNAPYECKRTRNLLKVKKMQTMDLKVIDMEEGEGINKGRLGALKVEFPAPDGNTYTVDVGGGFTFEDRDYYWNHPNSIIGKIIEVQYFEVSQNEKGGYALRFPVFKWVREDKSEPSIY